MGYMYEGAFKVGGYTVETDGCGRRPSAQLCKRPARFLFIPPLWTTRRHLLPIVPKSGPQDPVSTKPTCKATVVSSVRTSQYSTIEARPLQMNTAPPAAVPPSRIAQESKRPPPRRKRSVRTAERSQYISFGSPNGGRHYAALSLPSANAFPSGCFETLPPWP